MTFTHHDHTNTVVAVISYWLRDLTLDLNFHFPSELRQIIASFFQKNVCFVSYELTNDNIPLH